MSFHNENLFKKNILIVVKRNVKKTPKWRFRSLYRIKKPFLLDLQIVIKF